MDVNIIKVEKIGGFKITLENGLQFFEVPDSHDNTKFYLLIDMVGKNKDKLMIGYIDYIERSFNGCF